MAPLTAPVGSLLFRSLRVHQVYGANTDVGKTIFTTLLCNAAKGFRPGDRSSFLKPVSTGSLEEADSHHISRFAPGVSFDTLYQYDIPASPHLAARASGKDIPSDLSILKKIQDQAQKCATQGAGWLFLETAGGVHSPGPSGSTQADLYAPLRLPVVLVGDSRLGGISQTISAFEALHIRGYTVDAVLLFKDKQYENYLYLNDYFEERQGPIVKVVEEPPLRDDDIAADEKALKGYYGNNQSQGIAREVLEHLSQQHEARISRLESMASLAHQKIWYPFTQHTLIPPEKLTVIDSAHGDNFQTLVKSDSSSGSQATGPEPVLRPSFDGSASWWTQGLGHANPKLTLAASHAAGRYGHVMFAEAVHEPALKLAETLLAGMRNPRLTRVFYSDNGSTATEVAVKMGLRTSRVRYYEGRSSGEDVPRQLGVLGFKGSYHGDTIGAMDCSEPCTFNEKVEWYDGKGFWFDFPQIKCRAGKWTVDVPPELKDQLGEGRQFGSLTEVFNVERRETEEECRRYEQYIVSTLQSLRDEGHRFGALMMEPIVLGAGGQMLVDPLFQRTLVNVVRQNPHLFTQPSKEPTASAADAADPNAWSGLPVIFDEVYTGLYRLGRFTASSLLGVHADISVHAKLLTGGLLPLSTTLASESVFRAFESPDKEDALLHGHSYTAHAVGCQVAIESLGSMQRMEQQRSWDWAKADWQNGSAAPVATKPGSTADVWSMWSNDLVNWLSHQTSRVDGVWALGSVLAVHMKSADGIGYTSTAAAEVRTHMLSGSQDGAWNVHCRVLGNAFYLMAGQQTSEEDVRRVEGLLRGAFK